MLQVVKETLVQMVQPTPPLQVERVAQEEQAVQEERVAQEAPEETAEELFLLLLKQSSVQAK